MGVELRPLGVRCNIQCQYCYQNPQRDAGEGRRPYDLERMKAALEAEGQPFTLFGGEPLLLPVADLEHLWAWGLAKFGSNSVQTNGTLVDDEHVRLFRTYRVSVGISIDGPGALNDVRWHGSLAKTRESTAKTEAAVERLCRERIVPSLIVTIHRGNATPEHLPVLRDWIRHLERLGVRAVRLHLLESESAMVREKYALSDEENVAVLLSFMQLQEELEFLKFDLFAEMRNLLLGEDNHTSCVWNACDPYTTPAVRGVEGLGHRSNCGRTNKDGIEFTKSPVLGFERYLALYETPQLYGGCQGCRFFLMCKGQCPGTAIDGDWRNRTEHCEVWKRLYQRIEADLVAQGVNPLSLSPQLQDHESHVLSRWRQGHPAYMFQVLRSSPPHPLRTSSMT